MKNGIEYFSLDVHLDRKFKLLEAEFGILGFGVIIKLFQEIYGQEGYFVQWDDESCMLFCFDNGFSKKEVERIVLCAVDRGIFDKKLFEKEKILTSAGILKRYLEATKRRKSVDLVKEYLTFDVKDYINVNILSKNADNFKQSKVKESKVKESKVDKSKEIDSYTKNDKLSNLLFEFFEKKKIRDKKTIELYFSRLSRLASKEEERIEIVENTLRNGWNDFYPTKKEKEEKGGYIKGDEKYDEAYLFGI